MWGGRLLFYRESSQKRKSSLAEMVFEQRPEGGGKHTMQIFGERAFEVEETGTKASGRSVFGIFNRLLGDQYV